MNDSNTLPRWIVKSIDPKNPRPYLSEHTYEEATWGHQQAEAHQFTLVADAHEKRDYLGIETLRVFRLVPRSWLPWGEAHVKAAKVECFRWAAEEIETGSPDRASWMFMIGQLYTGSEHLFMREIAALLPTQREIDRFRRRIDDRSAGRVDVKEEVFFRVRLRGGLYVPERGDDETSGVEAKEARRRENGCHMDQTAAGIVGARVVEVKLKRRRILRKAAA